MPGCLSLADELVLRPLVAHAISLSELGDSVKKRGRKAELMMARDGLAEG